MRTPKPSNYFNIEDITGIKELKAIVTYEGETGYYLLTTEDSKELMDENGIDNLVTEKEKININEKSLLRIDINWDTEFPKTICKKLMINTTVKIPKETEIRVKIGFKDKEDEEGKYNYVDYGYFYVFDEPEHVVETNSYEIIAYDNMYKSMKEYDDNPLPDNTFPIKHKDLLKLIFNKFGWKWQYNGQSQLPFENWGYYSEDIMVGNIYKGLNMTYRDILDDLCAVVGSLYFDEYNTLNVKLLDFTPEEIDITYENLNDVNINVGEPIHGIGTITLTNSENMTYIIKSGVIEGMVDETFDIGNNLFVQYTMNEPNDYDLVKDDITEILWSKSVGNKIDLSSTGILVIEPYDIINIYDMDNNLVSTSNITSNNIVVDNGLREDIIAEKTESYTANYVTSTPKTSDVKNAVINIDKANAQIVLKVDSNGNLAQVSLNGDADAGTSVSIKADDIDLSGKNIRLTTDDITISSTYFNVDKYGNLTANSGKIGNWNIESQSGNTYGALYSDNGSRRVYVQPFQSSYGYDTWIFSVQENGTGIFVVNGWGDVSGRNFTASGNISAKNIDHGDTTLNSSSNVHVNFNKTFDNVPSVTITPCTTTSGVIAPKVRNVSTTGFDAILGGSGLSNIYCTWIAIG